MAGRPTIGLNVALVDADDPLTTRAACHLRYIDAIIEAGGLPMVVPPFEDTALFDQALAPLDGFCLIGGLDYDPQAYGGHAQPVHQLLEPRLQRSDAILIERLLERSRRPLLGICRGAQLMNIGRGGGLVQDIASEWRATDGAVHQHSANERAGSAQAGNAFRHALRVRAASRLAGIVTGEKLSVNSFHHQAIDPQRLGRGVAASAWSDDGVVEAIEVDAGERFAIGVQWHPERMRDDPRQRALFTALVEAARKG